MLAETTFFFFWKFNACNQKTIKFMIKIIPEEWVVDDVN